MNDLILTLERVTRDLDEIGLPWALVGAMAVAAWAEARMTLDLDVAVCVADHHERRRAVDELRARAYRWEASFANDAMVSFAVPEAGGLRLDLLFSLAGIETEVAQHAVRLTLAPGLELPVARLGDLIALKLLSAGQPGREHDLRDLRALVGVATAVDLDHSRAAIGLLIARGAASRETLEAKLEQLLADKP